MIKTTTPDTQRTRIVSPKTFSCRYVHKSDGQPLRAGGGDGRTGNTTHSAGVTRLHMLTRWPTHSNGAV
ncbi:hypothetical protein BaRGS_00007522 [Batillaria attramentaria]|uniref:Uncharacterized protein n=1 Tax=Batillaria attramentaria TaxID=370345 RepID=A0ABD0LPY9_9CAEN